VSDQYNNNNAKVSIVDINITVIFMLLPHSSPILDPKLLKVNKYFFAMYNLHAYKFGEGSPGNDYFHILTILLTLKY
jgi:hypothetical protein